ncbi:GcrA cell cycle regulator [Oceaniovalibus guishaninsula JLT2003]|uniref:GcrA cell cycle regulator n=1 Tax=Oceaniovalibus guishaninsula JLT2003 TaxID=1231392 RepID=K2HCW5_9RHOB|nr:GcrA family cell cycle regulator [Oceaniovalibus guishaninsula]EKE45258.1 GcrA cell cycle regulator [Oceaniovalibus guishaninsula JLT2003]
MSWTDERVETLKKMWGEGQSASAIAKTLGGVTRNAVIGKVHRLGLSNRAGGAPEGEGETELEEAAVPAEPVVEVVATEDPVEEEREIPSTQSAAPPPLTAARRQIIPAGQPLPPQPSANEISPETLASVREVEKTSKRISLMELTERTCKWPIGDPATADFWFCGLGVQAGKPYCEAHVSVAFQPMSSRRDRRR